VIQNGNFQSFDVPGSTFTQAWDINPSGSIVGEFRDAAGVFHGFLRMGTEHTSIDFPAAIGTHAFGINPGGAIVGIYTDTNNVTHGFLAVPAASN
jgi:probable HAF family extracellular repeat protein